MLNKSIDYYNYIENSVGLAIFNHISPLKRLHAPIKLTYKVGIFNYHHSKIGVVLG